MEAAKRADSMLGASRQTTASTDVLKMARDLIEKQTTQEISVHTAPTFIDNSDVCWKKLTTTPSLKDVLSKKVQQEDSRSMYTYVYMNSERELDIGGRTDCRTISRETLHTVYSCMCANQTHFFMAFSSFIT